MIYEYTKGWRFMCLEQELMLCYYRLNPSRLKRKSGGPATITPSLLGEMLLHSHQVKVNNYGAVDTLL